MSKPTHSKFLENVLKSSLMRPFALITKYVRLAILLLFGAGLSACTSESPRLGRDDGLDVVYASAPQGGDPHDGQGWYAFAWWLQHLGVNGNQLLCAGENRSINGETPSSSRLSASYFSAATCQRVSQSYDLGSVLLRCRSWDAREYFIDVSLDGDSCRFSESVTAPVLFPD